MQLTPYSEIQYYHDGRPKFKVVGFDEEKMFTTTEKITIDQAMRNAVRWRNLQLGLEMSAKDESTITRFIKSLEEDDKPKQAKVEPPKPKTIIPEHVKVTQLPSGVVRTSEELDKRGWNDGVGFPASIPSESKKQRYSEDLPTGGKIIKTVSAISIQKPRKVRQANAPTVASLINARNAEYPSLPGGVNIIRCKADTSIRFSVAIPPYIPGNKAKNRVFHVSTVSKFTLSQYRMVRHIAICFRKEVIAAYAEKREIDLDAFVDAKRKVLENDFRWPFTGTLPKNPSLVKGTVIEPKPSPLALRNRRFPNLPSGLTVRRITKQDSDPQVIFQVNLNDRKTRQFYVGEAGSFSLAEYRVIRHVAIAYRVEFLEAKLEGREMRLELFEDWRKKMQLGEFFKPFKGTLPPNISKPKVVPNGSHGGVTRANAATKEIIEYLMSFPELAPGFIQLDDLSAAKIQSKINDIVHNAIYPYRQ